MSGPVVLYAEDDPNDAFFMERAFTKLQRASSLKVVPDGQHAIDYLAGAGDFGDRARFPLPGLLLLDVKMPRRSGLEVLQWVRAQPDLARMPVVMFTSSTQRADIEFSRTHGANAFLAKPSNAEHLSLLVKEILAAAEEADLPEVTGNFLR